MLAAAAIAAAAASADAHAERGTVVAIVSKDIPSYKSALAGVTRTLPGHPVEWLDQGEEPAIARIRARPPEVAVAIGARAAKAAVAAFPELPLVYCMVLDPTGHALFGSRVTGIPLEIALRDQVEAFKKAVKSLNRIGTVVASSRPPPDLKDAAAAAARLGVEIFVETAAEAGDFPAAVERLLPRIDGLIVLQEPAVVTRDTFRAALDAAMARRVPVLASTEEYARLGALVGLAVDHEQAGRDAALLAQALLAGKKASDLPPPRPKWRYIVNLTTATLLGATVAPEIVAGARTVR